MKANWMAAVAVFALAAPVLDIDTAAAQARGGGGRHVAGQIQTARGTSTVNRDVVRGQGRRSSNTQVTSPNGRTRSAQTEQSVDRENGTFNRSRVLTGANGQTRSVEGQAQRGEDGAYTFNRTATNPNGETRSQSGQAQVTRLENGRTVSGTYSTPNGDGSFNRSNTVTDGVRTIAADRTGPNGATSSSNTVIDREAGTVNRSTSQTGPNGATRATELSTVRTEAGYDATRTVTGVNGETRTQTGSFTVTPTAPPPPPAQ